MSSFISRFFFSRLIRHVCGGEIILMRLEDNNSTTDTDVINRWRSTLGPSKFFKNLYEVRGIFGETNFKNLRLYFSLADYRNIGHGSDSVEEREREYALFEEHLHCINDPAVELFQFDRLRAVESCE